ncbi:TPA: hypothetical protein G8O67_005307 [Salmonella enterica]|uniref:Bacteriocin n=1 Tax=Salmonella enterica TaxID=28901 RepID=A0A756I745_SALER|nr:hypothetical protein [Salmonella enterica]
METYVNSSILIDLNDEEIELVGAAGFGGAITGALHGAVYGGIGGALGAFGSTGNYHHGVVGGISGAIGGGAVGALQGWHR